MLVITNKTLQNIQCYSYEKLFSTLDLYFENIIYHDIKNKNPSQNNDIINDIVEKNNIDTLWFFRSYYNPAFYENGNLIMNINIANFMKKKINIIFSCSDLDNVSRGNDKLVNFINKMSKYEKFYILDTFLYKNLIKKNIFINEQNFIQVKHFAYNEFTEIKFNENPINKIILSGAINNSYPSRQKYKNYGLVNTTKVFIADRNDETSDRKYYHILNEYIAGFAGVACGTGFILAKFFEIPATGSLLLADVNDIDELNNVGFYDNYNCLVVKNDNYEEMTNYILNLDNKKIIDEIRIKGRENIIQNHTLEHRLNQFEEIFYKLSPNIKKKSIQYAFSKSQ